MSSSYFYKGRITGVKIRHGGNDQIPGLKSDQPPPYSLGDMRSPDGMALRWEAESLATRLALRLAEHIWVTEPYKCLATLLPSVRTTTYLEKRVKDQIYPVIRALCVVQWYIRNGKPLRDPTIVWDSHLGLGPALLAIWSSEDVPLVLGADCRTSDVVRESVRRARWTVKMQLRRINGLPHTAPVGSARASLAGNAGHSPSIPSSNSTVIAQHYAEGFDPTRRSDLFWYPGSRVEPHRILVYFQEGDSHVPKSHPSPEFQQLEGWGMRWVELDRSVANLDLPPVLNWTLPASTLVTRFRQALSSTKPRDPMDRWVTWASEFLLRDVEYWRSFYEKHNVKVLFDPEEGYYRDIAQSVALDLSDGIRLGKQRSENLGWEGSQLGYHPDHVFFTWGNRSITDLVNSQNRVDHVLISGFPNDAAFSQNAESSLALRVQLAARGARFVVAFFDETFGQDVQFSKSMMQAMYTQFLQWVIDDPEVGLVTKSKKAAAIEGLPEIRELLTKAEATGRYVRLTDAFGRLPSDASQAADISVGLGISSAVTEGVVAGGRGIHCDLTHMRSHPFYQWGYDKLVFDDLERLMIALKCYKENPASEPGLGDFSPVIDQLDPFRDGKAGERIGSYISWLLEASDKGHDRDTAIRTANEQYVRMWSANKAISLIESTGVESAR